MYEILEAAPTTTILIDFAICTPEQLKGTVLLIRSSFVSLLTYGV
jgi:hypothetical protein